MRVLLLGLLLFPCTLTAVEMGDRQYAEDRVHEIEQALAQWREIAETAPSLPPAEAIPKLGLGVRKTADPTPYRLGDREGTHRKLQEALLAIPGHAEFYGRLIDQAMDIYVKEGPYAKSNLEQTQLDAHMVLKNLPSRETVRMLGEMLSDTRGVVKMKADGSNLDEWLSQVPNRAFAVMTLRSLLEDTPPLLRDNRGEEDFLPWIQWYEGIKSGKRGFRFKGDPKEYHLAGA
ncbi:MAG: hypothetical protein EOP84_27445 [Verrucomicrobiaceae bacterium]|nr:MAG: hypothetical protein EOP84_27445 [Verrucomicrobiaceae bacterium]